MKLSDLPPLFIDGDYPDLALALRELKGDKTIDLPDIKPLFGLGYYDGVMYALCMCEGEYFYGKAAYFLWRDWWAFWTLTAEEVEILLAEHALFEEHVGSHTTYVEDEHGAFRRKGACKPQATWDLYYKSPDRRTASHNIINNITSRDIFGFERNPFLGS